MPLAIQTLCQRSHSSSRGSLNISCKVQAPALCTIRVTLVLKAGHESGEPLMTSCKMRLVRAFQSSGQGIRGNFLMVAGGAILHLCGYAQIWMADPE